MLEDQQNAMYCCYWYENAAREARINNILPIRAINDPFSERDPRILIS